VDPKNIVILVVIVLATIFCWAFWTGKRWIRLYFLVLSVLVGLIAAAVSQALNLASVVEPANVVAIAFSFAASAAGPGLWRDEIRQDLERGGRLYSAISPADFLSWWGVLKLVDRLGARGAALAYLVPLVVALGAALVLQPLGVAGDRVPFLIALSPVAVFSLLSTWYVYRAARRLVPGS
jgi:hypothetical protein